MVRRFQKGSGMENNRQTAGESTQLPPDGETVQKNDPWHSHRILPTVFSVLAAIVVTVILTYTLTSAAQKKEYTAQLAAMQEQIRFLEGDGNGSGNLQTLIKTFHEYSYYGDALNDEAMLEAAFRAYVSASGDDYAQYYTEAEYKALVDSDRYAGIGVTVSQASVLYGDTETNVLFIEAVTAGSPAEDAGLRAGDRIYSVESAGVMKTMDELGYDGTVALIRGEKGTDVRLGILRETAENVFTPLTVSVTRTEYDVKTVEGYLIESDPTVGVVQIAAFRNATPVQFRGAVDSLLSQGATRFVFDVRGNPGGDLNAIRAVLSCFLRDGDLFLEALDGKGNVQTTYRIQPVTLSGDAAGCSVTADMIGIYRDLDFVVLCDENTASAAEVFTETMRDYQLARAIVGRTTFGKGIMQSIIQLPFRETVAYLRFTTHAYRTACGTSYHRVGIVPDVDVQLPASAAGISPFSLPWETDTQLRAAVSVLDGAE